MPPGQPLIVVVEVNGVVVDDFSVVSLVWPGFVMTVESESGPGIGVAPEPERGLEAEAGPFEVSRQL